MSKLPEARNPPRAFTRSKLFAVAAASVALCYILLDYLDLDDYLTFSALSGTTNFAISTVSSAGPIGILLLMLMESASLPIPSEVVLPLAGFLAYQGRMDLGEALIASVIGSMGGSFIDYAVGYALGASALKRFHWWSSKQVEHSIYWFQKYGTHAVFFARFVVGLRTLISFPAGAFKMNVARFSLITLLASCIWNAALLYAGYALGSRWVYVTSLFKVYLLPASAVAVVAIAALLPPILLLRKRKARRQDGKALRRRPYRRP